MNSIENEAFYNCSNLKNVYFSGSKSQWDTISFGASNDKLKSASLHYNYSPVITYNANGGINAPEAQVKKLFEDITLSQSVPSRDGYNFLGWSTTSNGSVEYAPGDIYTIDNDMILYAVWEVVGYTITYDANGGTGAPSSQKFEPGTTVSLSTVIPKREGYNFLGWSTSKAATSASYSAGATYVDNGDVDVTLYAVWQEKTYAVSYNANGGSSAPGSQTKEYFDNLVLTSSIPTRTGYTFLGWSTTSDGEVEYNPGDTYSKNEEVTLYAVWNAHKYTISYDANGGTGAPENQIK